MEIIDMHKIYWKVPLFYAKQTSNGSNKGKEAARNEIEPDETTINLPILLKSIRDQKHNNEHAKP